MKFHEPTTVEEAVALLAADPSSRCLAGGATLVAMMNAQLVEPGALVSLRRIAALHGISATAGGDLRIGAMTPHKAVARSDLFDAGQRVVRQAAAAIGHPAIRSMGTIGGAVSHADPAADYPAAITAADAVVEVEGAAGRRDIAAADFFVDYLETALEPGEIVTAIRVPRGPAGTVGAYEKFARVAGDFATASVAVRLGLARGRCSGIRIAVGGCGPRPVRDERAEERLLNSALDEASVRAAGEMLAKACDPVDDFRGSAEYRRMLVPELLARALAAARQAAEATP
jgi:carbon-monoxide dehydrogenase medium subunit